MGKQGQAALGVILAVILTYGVWMSKAHAGSLDAPAAPTDDNSAMYTLEDVYQRLNTGAEGMKRTGGFAEPAAGPGSTGRTLDDLYNKAPEPDDENGATAADVADGKTFWGLTGGEWGEQTGSATIGCCDCSEGTLYRDRYCDNGDGTVTDLTSCLVWLQNASCLGGKKWVDTSTWDDAQTSSGTLESGDCGLSDGSTVGDWRLPTKNELYGLTNGTEPIRSGSSAPFSGVQNGCYWTSTTYGTNTLYAWTVYLDNGSTFLIAKTSPFYVWPVRNGQ